MKLTLRCRIGLEFFKFLKETNQASIEDRQQLKVIYGVFRERNARAKYPNFASVIYALKITGKITIRGDTIQFNPKVRDLYEDQWQNCRGRQPQAAQERAAIARPGQTLPTPDAAEMQLRNRKKLATRLLEKLKTDRVPLISDKYGITINSDHQFENGTLCLHAKFTYEYVINLNVRNNGTEPVYFTCYIPLHQLICFTLMDEHKVTKTKPLTLKPGDSYEIKVCLRCRCVGFYPAALAFEFKPDLRPSSNAFYILRFIEISFLTSLGEELAPIAPYKTCPLLKWVPGRNCTIKDGQRPDKQSGMNQETVVPLKKYPLPQDMNQFIKSLKKPTLFPNKRRALLESPLCWEDYTDKLQLLLFLEEHQMMVDIRKYNIPNNEQKYAVMSRDKVNKKLLVLEVPGLSENRPSLLRGDELLVFPVGETGEKYRGYVHVVESERVKLGFSSELLDRFVDSMKFGVEFYFNRLTLHLQHRAAELAAQGRLGKVLFPADPSPQQSELPDLRFFNSQLEKNPEQKLAIQRIVAGSSKPAPYLVFGPPGTGKTVTLVEAIKQIEKTQASCHILACAPCNSTADQLCIMILENVDRHKVYRIYAQNWDPKFIPEKIKSKVCSNLEGEFYNFPAKEKLMEYRIIVTTLFTAGRLVTGGIPAGHFSHVFVDEAGQAVETECLIPLAGLLDVETGQVVLAGDPKQLGPILRSPFALKYNMGVSMLERMMRDFSLYQKNKGSFDNRFVTKLLRNYRSHPAILEISNELFYEGELQYHADEVLRNSYCNWDHLPQKGFPLIFHGITGVDEREASSPSFFNRAEVEVLMDYLKKLLQTKGKNGLPTLSAAHIGIIAPYRKQVQKIKKALEKVGKDLKIKDIDTLKVGSVEEFQGQERRIIMVSAVRSSCDYLELDKKFSLGFVENKKRFNVAMTRAKALLIVVGNPRVLSKDPTWKRFIQYCRERGGCTPDFPFEEDELFVMRLAALCIAMEPQVETAESDVQQQEDPEWRIDL